MTLRLVTAPSSAPVTVDEAKAYLRVEHEAEDDLIADLIAAAAGMLDGRHGVLGRALEPQTWELVLDAFPAAEIELPLGPVAEVVSITYMDPGGAEKAVAPADYTVDAVGPGGWVIPHRPWPHPMRTANAVRIVFVAGTGTPAPLRDIILRMVAARYDDRTATMLSRGILADLVQFRRYRI